jgi:proteic killer suppression protein
MIVSIAHKGLADFYETGGKAGIIARQAKRLKLILIALDTAVTIGDMDLPGFALHQLRGRKAGRWSVSVNGNWRVTFEFRDGNAYVVDYEDYH